MLEAPLSSLDPTLAVLVLVGALTVALLLVSAFAYRPFRRWERQQMRAREMVRAYRLRTGIGSGVALFLFFWLGGVTASPDGWRFLAVAVPVFALFMSVLGPWAGFVRSGRSADWRRAVCEARRQRRKAA